MGRALTYCTGEPIRVGWTVWIGEWVGVIESIVTKAGEGPPMSRKLRIEYPGAMYHVMTRGAQLTVSGVMRGCWDDSSG